MKPSTKFNILMLTGCAFMMIDVFSKPLGIPSSFDTIPILIAVVFIFLAYRISKKAKTAGQTSLFPTVSETQKRRKFRLTIISCAVVSIAAPFWLPYTGMTLPFGELVIISTSSFFVCLGAIWLGMKM